MYKIYLLTLKRPIYLSNDPPGRYITLSGSGSIKFIGGFINETDYNDLFSAAEGYTLTSSGKKEEENGCKVFQCTLFLIANTVYSAE